MNYPLLTRRLISFAAHRIALTTEYQESEIRSHIVALAHKESQILYRQPLMRVIEEIDEYLPIESLQNQALLDQEFVEVQEQLREAKTKLALLRRKRITPSPQDYQLAEQQVAQYLKLQNLESVELSAREKFHLAKIRGLKIPQTWGYLGSDYQALVEPVLQEIVLKNKPVGYITRNSYGVAVVNTPHVMFVDIDIEKDFDISSQSFPWEISPWSKDGIGEERILAEIADLVRDWGLTFEIYRTRNGLRLIEMSQLWNPLSEQSGAVLERLGSDRLYQRLCKAQDCYRARLELKPWRIGNAVCKYVARHSDGAPDHSESVLIKQIHDSWCLGGEILA